MILTPSQKLPLLKPGTIWQRKVNGALQRVYIESTHTRLLRHSDGWADIQTPFGIEPVKYSTILERYEFLGWARIKLPDLCSDKNLIPLTIDPTGERNAR